MWGASPLSGNLYLIRASSKGDRGTDVYIATRDAFFSHRNHLGIGDEVGDHGGTYRERSNRSVAERDVRMGPQRNWSVGDNFG